MAVKVTLTLTWDGTGSLHYGASESHYLLATPTNLEDLAPAVRELCERRVELNAGNVTLTEVRLSRVFQVGPFLRGNRSTLTMVTAVNPKLNRFGLPSVGTNYTTLSANHPNGCLVCPTTARTNEQAHGRISLTGIPDALLGTDPPGPKLDEVPGFFGLFDLYAQVLTGDTAQWAFLAKMPVEDPFPAPILSWDNEVGGTGRLTFQLPVAQDVGDERDVVQIRGVSMLSSAFARPNGQYRIAVKATDAGIVTYTLRSTEGFVAAQIDEPGTAEPVQKALYQYKSVQLGKESTRKRGVGSVRPRGRSSRRSRRLV